MSRNTALITGAAQTQAQADLDNYAAGVAAHLGGDWSGHAQVNQWQQFYTAPAPVGVVSGHIFRFLLTRSDGTDVAVVCPAFPVEAVTVGGVPVIALQPLAQTVAAGNPYQLRVYAASDIDITYQWQVSADNGGTFTDIASAFSPVYLVPAAVAPVSPASAWYYRCFVSNARGGIYSSAAAITVS